MTRPVIWWALWAASVRVPNAVAPLALVFLGQATTGSYGRGGLLAALFVLGEVVGAGVAAWAPARAVGRTGVVVGLGLGATGFAILAVTGQLWWSVAGAVAAGLGPAPSTGYVRVVLGGLVGEEGTARAYSADSALTELVWLAAPLLVSAAVVSTGVGPLLALCTAFLATSCVIGRARRQPISSTPPATAPRATTAGWSCRGVLSAWPIYLSSAAALVMLAAVEVVLPALLASRGQAVAWAGPLLAVTAVAGATTSVVYGTRPWPGSTGTHALVMLAVTAVALVILSLAAEPLLMAVVLSAAGASQAVVMTARNLSVRASFDVELQSRAFNLMYAVQGAGYSVGAVLTSTLIASAGPPPALLAGVGLAVLLSVVACAGRAGPPQDRPLDPVPG